MTVTESKTEREPMVRLAPPPATTALVPRVIGSLRRIVLERRPSRLPEVVDGVLDEPQARSKAAIPPVLLSFLLLVVLPAAVISFYFMFLAADQFTAEARFAVRNAELDGTPIVGDKGSSGSLPAVGSQDADIIASYIRSRTIIDDLSKTIDIRAIFARPEADFWARLPSDATREDVETFWLKMVGTYIENSSGIVTLKVRAFRREDALQLAKAILVVSETLANSLSARARADMMRRAQTEVQRADVQMRDALGELGRYRDTEGFIDPVKAATDTGKLLTQVLSEKIRLETVLYAGKQTNPNSPTLPPLQAQLAGIDQQIVKLRGQLAGGEARNRNLAASLVRFEEIEVRRQFAETMYTFARNGLDRARQAAERQSIYVSVFVPPTLPQEYSYPSRFTFSILASVTLLIMWSIGAMIWASVLDHRL